MLDRLYSNYALGIETNKISIKLAYITFTKGIMHVNLQNIPNKNSQTKNKDVKPLYINADQALKDVSSKWITVSALKGSEALVRSLEVKLAKEKDVFAVLPFQAEPLLPFPIDQAVLDSLILLQTKNSTSLTLVALKKENLQKHLESLQESGMDPEVVSTVPLALAQFSQQFLGTSIDKPIGIIHIGIDETVCVLAVNGKLLASHAFPFGITSISKELAKEKNLSIEEAESLLLTTDLSQMEPQAYPQLCPFLEMFRLEIAKTMLALTKQVKIQQVHAVLTTGEGVSIPGLSSWLKQKITLPFLLPIANANYSAQQLQEYAIPIGLALSVLRTSKKAVNFRQGAFAYGQPWKHFRVPLMIFGGLSCLVALVLFFFGQVWLGYQQDQIKERYVSFLASIDKPYAEVSNDSSTPIKKISGNEILLQLEKLQKEMQSTPDIFPLLPNVPRVSDVLAWLSTHPIIGSNAGNLSGLKLESFSYTMIKRPEQTKRQEKYQVKIELEFTTPTPKLAREFHDALIAPNEMVDPKGEVKWNASRDHYRTSFILKEKASVLQGI